MKLQGGMKMMNGVVDIAGDRVAFIAEDGREMFEVRAGKDGRSIEVRGIETCRVNGKVYTSGLEIRPHVTNSITIRTQLYEVDTGTEPK